MELIKVNNINSISSKEFELIKEKIINTFNILNYNTDNMSFYYERHSNGSSILAIKLSNGDDQDMDNYMVNGCLVEYRDNNKPSCDIGFHANAKVSKRAMYLANILNEAIISFFENVEEELFKNNLTNIECSVRIPIGNIVKNSQIKKENKLKRRLLCLFKK